MVTKISFFEDKQLFVQPVFSHIATKLHPPSAPATLVNRPRLKQVLNQSIDHKLTVISAPAGYGKSTLLGEWSRAGERPVAWLSLDANDNDPSRFWSYVVAALGKLDAGFDQLLPMFHAAAPDINFILIGLINAVAAIEDHFALIVDDYHLIDCEDVHRTVAFFIDYLPANAHVILSSRTAPALPLAKWRAQGHLLEIRTDDLRFAEAETQTLFNRAINRPLSSDDLDTIQSRTEGWAAGLHLAALLARQQPEQTAVATLHNFNGDHRYVVDYLATEVLQQQPELIRAFLLKTAVLDDLPVDLCNAITHRTDSAEVLAQLEARNLFIIPGDCACQTYRYHHLFIDFLRHRLQQLPGYNLNALHQDAATWYEQHGQIDQAIKHTLAAGDISRAATLIERVAQHYLQRGELRTVRGWLEALPEEIWRGNPHFCTVYAWILTHAGQTDRAEACLIAIEAAGPEVALTWRGRIEAVRTRMAVVRSDLEATLRHSECALAHLTDDDLLWRGEVRLDQTYPYQVARQFESTRLAYEEAIAIGERTGNTRLALLAGYYQGRLLQNMGRYHEAAQQYQRRIDWCHRSDPHLGAVCWAYTGLGELLCEWNSLPEATAYLRKAIQLARQIGETKVLVYAGNALAHALQALDKPVEAEEALAGAEEVARRSQIVSLIDETERAQILLWLRRGAVEQAVAWAQKHGRSLQADPADALSNNIPLWVAVSHSEQTRIAPPAEVIAILRERLKLAQTGGLMGLWVKESLWLAVALHAHGETEAAFEVFNQTLPVAQPMALCRTYSDAGPTIAGFLRRTEPAGTPPVAAPAEMCPVAAESLFAVEPLKQREVEVLRHIAAGYSNEEIAREMIIAASTVKWHLKNIYQKLQVSRRTQALAKAKELNLL